MTRYLCIGCEVLARPLYMAAALSRNVIDIKILRRGLHNTPRDLQSALQAEIDQAEGRGYEAVLLGYGLCGNGTASLHARSIPLVIPRLHDCIGLLLGDPARYRREYDQSPGTYWYTRDFMERSDGDTKYTSLGSTTADEMQKQYEVFLQKYGQEKADYLMEVMSSWQSHYERAVFINLDLADEEEFEQETQAAASRHGWRFEKLAGDLLMFHQLLDGEWGENFIVIRPNQRLGLAYDDKIFCVEPHEPGE